MAVIIRIQVIELRRLGDTVCNSTRFCAFDGVDQDPCLAAHSKWADAPLDFLSECSDKKSRTAVNVKSYAVGTKNAAFQRRL